MLPKLAAMVQDVGVVATGVFQCVGKDSKASVVKHSSWQTAVVVGGLSQIKYRGREPSGSDGHRAEGKSAIDTSHGFAIPFQIIRRIIIYSSCEHPPTKTNIRPCSLNGHVERSVTVGKGRFVGLLKRLR